MFKMIGRILDTTGKYRGRVLAAFVFSFLKAMAAKAPILLAFWILSKFLTGSVTGTDCILAAVIGVGILIAESLCQYGSDRLQSAAGYMVFADMRMRLGQHLRKMPMGYFTEGNIGKISSVLSTDMVFIEEKCMQAIANLMSDLFSQVILVVFMLLFSPILGLASAAVVLVIWAVGHHAEKVNLAHSRDKQEQSEHLTDAVLDFVEGIGVIKSYNLLGEKSKQLSDNFDRSCNKSLEYELALAPTTAVLMMATGGGSAVILGLSLYLWWTGALAAPYLIGMVLFVMDLFMPARAFFAQISRLTVMDACMDRIDQVFAEKTLPNEGTETNVQGKTVEFQNVSFAYDEKEVLHDVSFTMQKGTMTALVGPSGGGKSTVANLLSRFWDVKNGSILIDGVDIRKLPLATLMDQISVVFQRVYLFKDTVYSNISMGRPTATREEVIEAAKRARCYDFIMALPEGFDTVIGEGGASLSGGEMQRISIARCILKDAPIVILDEATASVDADNESFIQQAITELCRGKTLLVIAHRLNTIRGADQILVIQNGSVVQKGTHEALMEQEGLYRNFVNVRRESRGWSSSRSAE